MIWVTLTNKIIKVRITKSEKKKKQKQENENLGKDNENMAHLKIMIYLPINILLSK